MRLVLASKTRGLMYGEWIVHRGKWGQYQKTECGRSVVKELDEAGLDTLEPWRFCQRDACWRRGRYQRGGRG